MPQLMWPLRCLRLALAVQILGGVPNLESQNLAASMAEILATAGGQLLLHTFLFYSNI